MKIKIKFFVLFHSSSEGMSFLRKPRKGQSFYENDIDSQSIVMEKKS